MLPTNPLDWDQTAREELAERAAIILDGCFRGDPACCPEAHRMAVRCVRFRVDRERGLVFPVLKPHGKEHQRNARQG
jgi:hypothetical protein